VKRCEELPGQHLFQYIDADGERRSVTSDDVNDYLREAGGDFTAKDFRTWGATVLATCALREIAQFESEAEAKRNVVAAIDSVARKLGHTRAICRQSYVHPAVIDVYLDGSLPATLERAAAKTAGPLRSDEAAALVLLRSRANSKVSKAAARLYEYGQSPRISSAA
jgi:DNA topoisomerase-1